MSEVIEIPEGMKAPVKFGPFTVDLTDWTVYVRAFDEDAEATQWLVETTVGLDKNLAYAPEGDFSTIPAGTSIGIEIWAEHNTSGERKALAPNADTEDPIRGYIREMVTFTPV